MLKTDNVYFNYVSDRVLLFEYFLRLFILNDTTKTNIEATPDASFSKIFNESLYHHTALELRGVIDISVDEWVVMAFQSFVHDFLENV